MNQKFFTKLRNAFGIVALFCALLSAGTVNAQSYLPNAQAVQVASATLDAINGGAASQFSTVSTVVDKGNFSKTVNDANSVESALFAVYLKMVLVELQQGVATGTAINNVYNTISNTTGASGGSRPALLDTVKQDVIDLLSV